MNGGVCMWVLNVRVTQGLPGWEKTPQKSMPGTTVYVSDRNYCTYPNGVGVVWYGSPNADRLHKNQ